MGVAERSREHVETKLEELEETHGSFAVKQTTITLPGERYTDLRERGNPDPVTASIAVRNEQGDVLHVGATGDPGLPEVEVALEDPLEPAVCAQVRDETGIDCAVDGVEQVTIVGLRHGDDPDAETLYNLVVVFSGDHLAGDPGSEATWRRPGPPRRPSVVR